MPTGADGWCAVLAAMRFMLVMDVTVVNVALAKLQQDLDFSRQGLAWMVNSGAAATPSATAP